MLNLFSVSLPRATMKVSPPHNFVVLELTKQLAIQTWFSAEVSSRFMLILPAHNSALLMKCLLLTRMLLLLEFPINITESARPLPKG